MKSTERFSADVDQYLKAYSCRDVATGSQTLIFNDIVHLGHDVAEN